MFRNTNLSNLRGSLLEGNNTDLLNSDENKFDFRKNLSMKEKVLRNTQIRNVHEKGGN